MKELNEYHKQQLAKKKIFQTFMRKHTHTYNLYEIDTISSKSDHLGMETLEKIGRAHV